jgi:type IV secretion system protein VirB10
MVGMNRSITAVLLCLGFAVFLPAKLNGQPVILGIPSSNLAPPALLVLPAGTVITIEATEILSSGKQQPGDNFSAELRHPLVVDGWVVARPGQTVVGRIAAATRAGRVKGTSKLLLELEGIVLVDGHQAPIETELVENSGPTSHGRDLAAIAITTGVGAAIGAVCGAKGAGIGAAVGAGAGVAGVLLTRGEDVEIGPEKLLTFRLSSPLPVSTETNQLAFWQVSPDDYPGPNQTVAPPRVPAAVGVVAQPAPLRIPISVLSEIQGLTIARPGHSECRQ